MPRLVHGSQFTVHSRHRRPGFTLVELLIVISLFALAAGLIGASYLSFERNQRLKSAALSLKSDIRLIQNKALSGDKSGVGACATNTTLVGWYLKVKTLDRYYTYSGDYLCGASEFNFPTTPPKRIELPKGILVSKITYGGSNCTGEINLLFRPITPAVSFFGVMPSADFVTASGSLNLASLLNCGGAGAELIIEFTNEFNSNKYNVVIKQTGEVSEKKI